MIYSWHQGSAINPIISGSEQGFGVHFQYLGFGIEILDFFWGDLVFFNAKCGIWVPGIPDCRPWLTYRRRIQIVKIYDSLCSMRGRHHSIKYEMSVKLPLSYLFLAIRIRPLYNGHRFFRKESYFPTKFFQFYHNIFLRLTTRGRHRYTSRYYK